MKKTMLMMFREDLSTPAKQLQYGSFEQTECVTLPIWSTEGDGRWSNERNLLQYYDSVEYPEYPNVTALPASAKLQKQWYGMQIDYRCKVRPDQNQEVTFKSGQVLAPQPYIGTILKRIIERSVTRLPTLTTRCATRATGSPTSSSPTHAAT